MRKRAAVPAWGRLGILKQEVWLYKTALCLSTVLERRKREGQVKIGQMGAEKEFQ